VGKNEKGGPSRDRAGGQRLPNCTAWRIFLLMKKFDRPRAPKRLSEKAKEWWAALVAQYEWETADQVMTLELLLDSFDEYITEREKLDVEGSVVKDRFGQVKANPRVTTCLNAKLTMLKCLRQLGLDIQPPGKIGRPPGS